jgi:hypothetical protein
MLLATAGTRNFQAARRTGLPGRIAPVGTETADHPAVVYVDLAGPPAAAGRQSVLATVGTLDRNRGPHHGRRRDRRRGRG